MADRIERTLSLPAPPETVWDFRSHQSSKTGWIEEAMAPVGTPLRRTGGAPFGPALIAA